MYIKSLYRHFLKSNGINTDTRKIIPGNIFFALKGPNYNANEFAGDAINAGADIVVIDDEQFAIPGDEKYFVVDDALTALQELARYHRKQLHFPIIGLTGSNGKTTTKELLNEVLKVKFRTVATSGNLNNHIGVPLTILGMGKEDEMGIVEMGANKPGDIRELCEIARPTHGIITNIGLAHLEGMGGPEGVLKTKGELFEYLKEYKGTVFINSQDPVISKLGIGIDKTVMYPSKGDFCEVSFQGADPFVKFKAEEEPTVHQSSLIGAYNFGNIAIALTVGKFFGVPTQKAVKAILGYKPSNMRSQLIEKRSNLIILDAYNANPSSMEVAIKGFAEMTGKKRKMLILGDMNELGESAEHQHQKLGELISRYDFDKICFTGNLIQAALSSAPERSLYFPDPFSFRNWLQDSKLEDYLILIKGSRSMKLEGLVEFI